MTATAARAADQTASATATQLTASTAHITVAASGGSPTTSREPPRPVGSRHRRRARTHERQPRGPTQASCR